MKRKTLLTIASMASAVALSNCTTSNIVAEANHNNHTQIKLEQANYKVVATQIKGESKGFHFLSALPTSIPTSLDDISNIMVDGGIAFKSATKSEALGNLYKNAGNQANRSTALINIREEKGGSNYFLFSRPKYIITADLIEFVR